MAFGLKTRMYTLEQAKSLADRQSLTAIQLVQANGSSHSRIGGVPSIPVGFAWPHWKDKPLAFLAQIDISEVAREHLPAWMPKEGQLYFFYDKEQATWGFDPADRGSWRVIYTKEAASDLIESPVPDGAEDDLYNSISLHFKEVVSRPDWQRLGIGAHEMSDEDFNDYIEWSTAPLGDDPRHQMFGNPIPVQGDEMELECQLVSNGVYCGNPEGYHSSRAAELAEGAGNWRLLLQLDSDDGAGMMWGDLGSLYFWVREEDARRADFTNVWMILQCG